LDTKRSEISCAFVAKGLFLARGQGQTYTASDFGTVSTRVKDLNQADWKKLMRVMKYLNSTRNKNLTLSADDLRVVK
jgi:hypothetical protein